MAITLGEALVYLTADDKGLDKTLDGAKQKTTKWAANLGASVASFAGAAVVAGATAAVGAIVGIGVAAVKVASQVDQSQRDMQTQLGLTAAEAENLANVTRTVYGDNFTGSIEEAGQAVTDTLLILGSAADGLANDELARLTEQGLALSDAFGVDLTESMRTATELMRTGVAKDFDDAMNIITTGFQDGVNASDDLLDTLNEYADDFADMGLSGGEVLGLLNRGLEAGAFNTDKLADSINEFGVRIRDPAIGDKVRDIDTGIAGIYDEFQAGSITERDALEGMLARIAAIEDPIKRDQAGVALFGSMWEDLGEKAILAMGGIEDGAISTANATESLNIQYDSFGNLLEGLKRKALLALEPIGESLLEIANQIMPYVTAAFEWISNWWESTGAAALTEFKDAISALFSGDTAAAWEHLMNAIDLVFGEGTSDKINELRDDIAIWAANTILKFNEVWDQIQLWWTKNVKPILDEVAIYFKKNWPAIAEAFANAWEFIKAAAMAFANVVKERVWPPIRDALNRIGQVFEDNGISISDVLDALGNGIKITAEIIGGVLAVLLAAVVAGWTGLARLFDTWVAGFIELGDSLGQIFEGFVELFVGLFAAIQGILEGDGELFKQGWSLMMSGIEDILVGSFESITTLIITTFSGILEFISGFTEGFLGFFVDLFEELGIDVPNWLNNIVEAFHNIDWWAIGKGLIDGIKEGFSGGFDGWLEDTKNRLNEFFGGVKEEEEIESPSRVTEREIGQPLGAGIIVGMNKAIQDMGGVISDTMNAQFGQITKQSRFADLGDPTWSNTNKLGQAVNWYGEDPVAAAQTAVDEQTIEAIKKANEAKLKESMAAMDAANAERLAAENASVGQHAPTVRENINMTIYADSQTNGEEVGKEAGKAYYDYLTNKGIQT